MSQKRAKARSSFRWREAGDKKEMPPLILVKSDGAVLYGTTDLATIVDRVKEQNPDLVLYVVDQRQHLHFEQVFRAARKAHINGQAVLEHAGFGTMNGTDGKPFKTRAGGVMKLYDLIATMTAEADKRLAEQGLANDYPEAEHMRHREEGRHRGAEVRRSLELPAHRLHLRSRPLRALRGQDRAVSAICRGAHPVDPAQGEGRRICVGRACRALAGRAHPDRCSSWRCRMKMQAAEDNRAPNILCEYAFELAQKFSRFYSEHHILSEADGELRAARLGLCEVTLATLAKVLDLLGIEIPARM